MSSTGFTPSVADDLALAIALAGEADLVSLPRFRALNLRVRRSRTAPR